MMWQVWQMWKSWPPECVFSNLLLEAEDDVVDLADVEVLAARLPRM
jgi:hypothetical protein